MKFDGDAASAAPDADARELDGTTRQRVLQLVVEKGPISAAQLGRELDLTAAAVRRHLDAMTEQGLVEIKAVSSRRQGAGRPSRRYVISSRGQQELGDDYLRLVRTALAVIDDDDKDAAAKSLAEAYFADFEQRYAPQLEQIQDLDERTEKLSTLFSADGFAGFTRLVGRDNPLLAMQSTQLCQGHCPVREIAAAHPVFCEEETAMIARLLDVDVRRLSTQAAGAHVCTTHVPVGRERLAAARADSARAGAQETSQTGRTAGRKRIVISPRQQERLS
ncbi:helix-turn-helix transcriptional regulator [Nesterenkonia sphaerica]|uniref:Winged helix-turn-helix transcriptional regulator n=1 Tax=Nesterenkonia sphaerica TaxID=1804988 RepID=A0A5R9ANJ1_9MICC|nr:helix-turn-helix domain-containing protein [Nesterenkonia sphaerica]TLP79466.1 winged helix-turn-helix transcriptional regulator [Nesterenkonia sphaerica]